MKAPRGTLAALTLAALTLAGVGVCAAALLLVGCSGAGRLETPMPDEEETEVEELVVRVLQTWPHDTEAFTQGLLWSEGRLYESTGEFGESTLRRVVLETGHVEAMRALDAHVFGEGLARYGDRLIQLTWRARTAIVSDFATLGEIDRLDYAGQGWGLCSDGERLYMSNGTDTLTIRHPDTFAVEGTLRVTVRGKARAGLNELEWAEGWIYANVFPTDEILRIDPSSGEVVATIDATGLLTADEARRADVLNGIAWHPERGSFLLTGKRWPWVFEATFVAR